MPAKARKTGLQLLLSSTLQTPAIRYQKGTKYTPEGGRTIQTIPRGIGLFQKQAAQLGTLTWSWWP